MGESIVGVIGCGNMGGAIVRGMIKKDFVSTKSILLNDKEIEKSNRLSEETGCINSELSALVRDANFVLIAVKPQDFNQLITQISDNIKEQTIISIAAGIKISTILEKLGKEVPVVRAMPNMAAFAGESITCLSYSSMVRNISEIKAIFAGIGEVIEIDEEFLDSITALSGSGPAYLFYLAEAMINAGCNAGLKENIAKELVVQTLYGSAKLLKEGESHPAQLIKKVASKGGTTEAALSVFDKEGMRDIIKKAIIKAKQRAEELSRG